jgi:hypothetical protein
MIAYSMTKTIAIDAPKGRVFAFLADAANWPKWAVVNVKSVRPAGDGWWDMETPAGPAKLRLRPDSELGVLDHDFHSPEASWTDRRDIDHAASLRIWCEYGDVDRADEAGGGVLANPLLPPCRIRR